MSETMPTVVVTGGSRGLGRAIAETLAQEGYQVYLTYVSRPDDANDVVKSIEAAGGKAKAFKLDTGDAKAIVDFFDNEIKDKVNLRALVNNAGMIKDGLMIRMKDEDFDRVIDVNLKGAFVATREAVKIMSKERKGYVVNMTSLSGERGNFGQTNYAASKAGLAGFTKAAALECASRGITVNAVSPGFISSDMTDSVKEEIKQKVIASIPLGRPGTPQEVADLVAFLVSGKADYLTGLEIAVNGGMYL